jgi:flagellar biosynthesis GTPase FlhF
VLICWEKRFRVRKTDFFDIEGKHPNIKPYVTDNERMTWTYMNYRINNSPADWRRVRKYLWKQTKPNNGELPRPGARTWGTLNDDDERGRTAHRPEEATDIIGDEIIVPGEDGTSQRPARKAGELNGTQAIWSKILEESRTAEEWWSAVAKQRPMEYQTKYSHLQQFAAHHFKKPIEEYDPEGFTDFPGITNDMRRWVEEELPKRDRPKGLILIGPTRLGKTRWARSLGK